VKVTVAVEQVTMARPVAVSRGAYAHADLVVVTLSDDGLTGRGECSPIAHYGWSAAQTVAEIEALSAELPRLSRQALQHRLPPGPTRNAIDCALWDLEAKRAGVSVWELAGIAPPDRQPTAMTLVMSDAADMARQAAKHAAFSTLKLKLGAEGAAEAIRAVRAARPDARLSIDANEGWSMAHMEALYPLFVEAGVAMVEQPLPAHGDAGLAATDAPVPLCADESFHHLGDLARVAGLYDYVNIKLDKCGGLTEALAILESAPAHGLKCMVGCMFATSLAVAPALLVAAGCDFVDLDGPLHLSSDRRDAFALANGAYLTQSSALWGAAA
jgi:L-alanine-DL-glutamate epimerase-like enolase superfamily enzyme